MKITYAVNLEDKLVRLSSMIDWNLLETSYQSHFQQASAPDPRLLFGLLYIQAKENISNEELMVRWEKSPEWQYFCGEKELRSDFPLHPSQLSIWLREIGPTGCQLMRAALAPSLPPIPDTLH